MVEQMFADERFSAGECAALMMSVLPERGGGQFYRQIAWHGVETAVRVLRMDMPFPTLDGMLKFVSDRKVLQSRIREIAPEFAEGGFFLAGKDEYEGALNVINGVAEKLKAANGIGVLMDFMAKERRRWGVCA